MVLFKRGGVWWYKFYFARQSIRESSKSTSKTVGRTRSNSGEGNSRLDSTTSKRFADIALWPVERLRRLIA